MALWGKNILGRRKSECKSPEGETCQVPALFRNFIMVSNVEGKE